MKVSGLDYEDVIEEIRNGDYDMLDISSNEHNDISSIEMPTLPDDCINLYDPSQIKFYGKNKIVMDALRYMYIRKLLNPINKPRSIYISLKDRFHKNRLIIPFFDLDGKITFYQSRKIFDWDEKTTYLSKLNSDKGLFNIENIDADKGDTIFIFEGPIDSCFIENGVALAGITEGYATLTPKQEDQLNNFRLFNKVWVLDSQYLDHTSKEKSEILLNQGERVFIWPCEDGKKYKDFNEKCVREGLQGIDQGYVLSNTYSGIAGLLKLQQCK